MKCGLTKNMLSVVTVIPKGAKDRNRRNALQLTMSKVPELCPGRVFAMLTGIAGAADADRQAFPAQGNITNPMLKKS